MPSSCSFRLVEFRSSPFFSNFIKAPEHFPCLSSVYGSPKLLTYLLAHADVPGVSWDVSVTHSLSRYLLSPPVPRFQVHTVALFLSHVLWSIHGTPKSSTQGWFRWCKYLYSIMILCTSVFYCIGSTLDSTAWAAHYIVHHME